MKLLEILNTSLINNRKEEFIQLLKDNPNHLQIDSNEDLDYEYSGSLYFVEFKFIQDEKQSNLDLDDFVHGLKVLVSIVQINKCLDFCINKKDSDSKLDLNLMVNELYYKLTNQNAHLQDLKTSDQLKKKYFDSLILLKQFKNNNNFNLLSQNTTENDSNLCDNLIAKSNFTSLSDSGHSEISSSDSSNNSSALLAGDLFNCNLLTHGEIQDCIIQTNAEHEQECLAVALINDSLSKENFAHTLYLLKNSLPHRNDKMIILDQNAYLYHFQMKQLKNVDFLYYFYFKFEN